MKRVGGCSVVLILEWNIVVGGMDCGLHVFCEVVDCRLGDLNIEFGLIVLPRGEEPKWDGAGGSGAF